MKNRAWLLAKKYITAKCRRQLALLVSVVLYTATACADMYEWTDDNGVVHFRSGNPGQTVIMYTRASCGWCKKARNYFRNRNIDFSEYDIDQSRRHQDEFDALHGTGTPLIRIGQDVIQGFDRPAIEAALKRSR